MKQNINDYSESVDTYENKMQVEETKCKRKIVKEDPVKLDGIEGEFTEVCRKKKNV